MLSTWKIAPALAAGCTVVHIPAELSPVTASMLVEVASPNRSTSIGSLIILTCWNFDNNTHIYSEIPGDMV